MGQVKADRIKNGFAPKHKPVFLWSMSSGLVPATTAATTTVAATTATAVATTAAAITTVATTAATAAVTTAATTAVAATTATTTAIAGTLFAGTSFVNDQGHAFKIGFVEGRNGLPGFGIFAHFYESETAAAARKFVHDNLSRLDFTVLLEQCTQLIAGGFKWNVGNVNVHRCAVKM